MTSACTDIRYSIALPVFKLYITGILLYVSIWLLIFLAQHHVRFIQVVACTCHFFTLYGCVGFHVRSISRIREALLSYMTECVYLQHDQITIKCFPKYLGAPTVSAGLRWLTPSPPKCHETWTCFSQSGWFLVISACCNLHLSCY